jgi:hypothetical protein
MRALVFCVGLVCISSTASGALAQQIPTFRSQIAAGVGLSTTSAKGDALDGPGLRLAYEYGRRRAFIGVMADAHTGFGREHFLKANATALLLTLGPQFSGEQATLRPSFRVGGGHAVQHDPRNGLAETTSPILGLGLELKLWISDWSFGLDLDGRAYLIPLEQHGGDYSMSWLLTESSCFLMVGRGF